VLNNQFDCFVLLGNKSPMNNYFDLKITNQIVQA